MRRLILLAVLTVLAVAAPAGAQERADSRDGTAAASPARFAPPALLPAEHWARRALVRLEAAALDDAGVDPAAGDLTVDDALTAFAAAAGRAGGDGHMASIVARWQERLDEEYPRRPGGLGLDVALGGSLREDAVRAREFWSNRDLGWEPPPATPAADTASAMVAPRLTAALAGRAWLEVEARARADDIAVVDAWAATRLGNVGLWAGRRTTGYRTARGGGLVLDPRVAWDGAGLWLRDPVRLPGFLRHVGRIHLEGFMALADSNGRAPRPWLLSTRFTLEPAPRFAVGVSRGIFFGAQNGSRKIDWEEMPRILAGYASEYVGDTLYHDNQVVAVDARWSPPLGALPLQLYLAWGTEDTAGAWWDSPGITGGLFVPFLPGAPELGLGLEHTVVTSTGAHGSFYEHYRLTDGWTRDGVVLGHGLGGDGREWILYGDVAAGRLDGEWKLLRRFRSRGNLHGRPGRSHGGQVAGRYALRDGIDLELRAFLEDGAGWTERALTAAVRLRWR